MIDRGKVSSYGRSVTAGDRTQGLLCLPVDAVVNRPSVCERGTVYVPGKTTFITYLACAALLCYLILLDATSDSKYNYTYDRQTAYNPADTPLLPQPF